MRIAVQGRTIRSCLPFGAALLLLAAAAVVGVRTEGRAEVASGGPTESAPARREVGGAGSRLEIVVPVGPPPVTVASQAPWGTTSERGGLRTRLVPLQDVFALGKPMKFRLEMQNLGPHDDYYQKRPHDAGDCLQVFGPLGEPVPYIGGSHPAAGPWESLGPSRTVVLFDGLDLFRQYALSRPGTYWVLFPGLPADQGATDAGRGKQAGGTPVRRPASIAKAGDRKAPDAFCYGIPRSNAVAIDVAGARFRRRGGSRRG